MSYGDGSWGKVLINGIEYVRCNKMYDGKRKSFTGKTKAEVKQKIKDYETKSKKLDVSEDIAKMSFYMYCHNWLFKWRKKEIKATTLDYYESIMDNAIKGTQLGSKQIKQINETKKQTVEAWLEQCLSNYAAKHSKSTVDGLYTILNQVCKYGYGQDDFSYNYMVNVEKITEKSVSVKKVEKDSLTTEQFLKLWNEMERVNTAEFRINGAVGTYVYGLLAYALVFQGFTGLRWGEISNIKWKDINIEDKYVIIDSQFVTIKNRDNSNTNKKRLVVETDPKSRDSKRIVPLSKQALEILDKIKNRWANMCRPDSLVFSNTGRACSNSNANRLLKQMCLRQGIPIITTQQLRHTFGSILLNEDEKNLYAVSAMMGHSSPDVTYKNYIDIFEKNKAKAISIFDNINTNGNPN